MLYNYIFFWSFTKKDIITLIFVNQKKLCISLELDSIVRPKRILKKRKIIAEFIVDETLLKVGNQYAWLWVAIEPVNK